MRGSIGDEILKMGFEGSPLCDKLKGQWFISGIWLDCPCYARHVKLIQGHRLGTESMFLLAPYIQMDIDFIRRKGLMLGHEGPGISDKSSS